MKNKKVLNVLVYIISAAIIIWLLVGRRMILPQVCEYGVDHHGQEVFVEYAGPIFPLDILGESKDISGERRINLDFTNCDNETKDMMVKDSYKLINNSGQDKTIKIIYPFASSINKSKKLTPTINIDGEIYPTKMIIGDYPSGFGKTYLAKESSDKNLERLISWRDYNSLLEDGRYFDIANEKNLLDDKKITVYTFEDICYEQENKDATFQFEFKIPKDQLVLTSNIFGVANSEEEDYSIYKYSFFAKQENVKHRIIVFGQAPKDYKLTGYENTMCKDSVDTITARVKVETMDLSKVIKQCIEECSTTDNNNEKTTSLITEEDLYNAVVSMMNYIVLGDEKSDRYKWGNMDDIIREFYSMDRVMYVAAEVSIPKGESKNINIIFPKEGSYNYDYGINKDYAGVRSYDMLTKLTNTMNFTNQKAGINLPDKYKIVDQNFGFDIDKGINEVELDVNKERYYIEIKENQ